MRPRPLALAVVAAALLAGGVLGPALRAQTDSGVTAPPTSPAPARAPAGRAAATTRPARVAPTPTSPVPAPPAAAGPTAPAPGGPGAPTAASGRCGVCHPGERAEFERSRHAREDVRCVSCHGGDPASLTLAVAHGRGFVGRPARAAIPRLCASCHADESRMRAYNLPVDQYALYQTSGHGRRLAAGDTRVAVCSDCHGAHAILPPSDPVSNVYTLNIPRTCGHCHGNPAIAAGLKDGRTVYQQYLGSVHGHELLDRANLRAPTCVSCHGVHGAAPPAIGDIDKVCGQCHTAERRYFIAGPHRAGLQQAGLPQCASCHNYHDIAPARPQRLATACAVCHGEGPEQQLGRRLFTEYRRASSELDKAAALTTRAEAVPLNTEDYNARLGEARTYLSEALPAAHAVREDVAAGFAARSRSVSREVESEIYAKLQEMRTRRIVLIVFWFYLLLTILILRWYKRGEPKS